MQTFRDGGVVEYEEYKEELAQSGHENFQHATEGKIIVNTLEHVTKAKRSKFASKSVLPQTSQNVKLFESSKNSLAVGDMWGIATSIQAISSYLKESKRQVVDLIHISSQCKRDIRFRPSW